MNKFTAEQIEKAMSCKTVAELLALAKESEIELTESEATSLFAELNSEDDSLSDSVLEAVSGGRNVICHMYKCRGCGGTTTIHCHTYTPFDEFICVKCKFRGMASMFIDVRN